MSLSFNDFQKQGYTFLPDAVLHLCLIGNFKQFQSRILFRNVAVLFEFWGKSPPRKESFLLHVEVGFGNVGFQSHWKCSSNIVFPSTGRSENEYGKPGDHYFMWNIWSILKESVPVDSTLAQNNFALLVYNIIYIGEQR